MVAGCGGGNSSSSSGSSESGGGKPLTAGSDIPYPPAKSNPREERTKKFLGLVLER